MEKYPEYNTLNLTEVADAVRAFWHEHHTFDKSVESREGQEPWVFFEGPPSANGKPGIHHVMSRTLKDLFCRYQTMKGRQVKRKAGWDTHGLPVELGVEKELGITKEDIGKTISIAEYNAACRKAVMRYTDVWNNLTEQMGYWVDMDDPYVTYETKYMETVWWLLRQLYDKDLLYKGYTIQPYSPKAGTGLSSHELNMPGTYRDVKDTTVIAQFRVKPTEKAQVLFPDVEGSVDLLAWTTTPWTLPSNTALTVGPNIPYVLVRSFNQYTEDSVHVVLAEPLVSKVFGKKFQTAESTEALEAYQPGDKKIPYRVVGRFSGSELVGLQYEQLLPYAQPMDRPEEAFRVIAGDFVTTEDGTGIVHTAPTFGADDMRVAQAAGVPPLLVPDENGNPVPLVDLQGRFRPEVHDPEFGLGGEYIKTEYLTDEQRDAEWKRQQDLLASIIPNLKEYLSVDERLALKLKLTGRAFQVEKYEHPYPHCWRTDKPVLYYPLDAWFVRSTAVKERLIELNKTIRWKPASTGEGRFGNWLENLNDWNLSRSRYWGIPLPIWRTEEGDEERCIGSVKELREACAQAVEACFMEKNPLEAFAPEDLSDMNYEQVDLHRPYMDEIVLVSSSGKPMHREADLIDVWFDSGSMPYAQWHYPFENRKLIEDNKAFPADFIAEGVDQTRGWFFTLHAIGTMAFDSVAYKNVVSNGLVLDKNGQKMSKRLGNAVEPFEAMDTYGPDAIRWYLMTNAQPWDNLRYDPEGVREVQRKFFRALHNTYAFFALYANVDGFTYEEDEIPWADRPEIDRWILSKLHSLVQEVDEAYSQYEPTRAGRAIQEFAVDHLSNWHVRLSRKRFWRGDYGPDKVSAYQTLYACLTTVAKLAAPIAPFYSDQLYRNLNAVAQREPYESVHLAYVPAVDTSRIDSDLETRMDYAQRISSMVLALRKQENLRVRQPLQKIMVPVLNERFEQQVSEVADLIRTEVNVKEIEFLRDTEGVLVKRIKPNFKALGPKYGKQMKAIAGAVQAFTQEDIGALEREGKKSISVGEETIVLEREDVEITTDDIPGWLVLTEGELTVALDITISEPLYREGLARELVNRIQNFRKDKGFEVTDTIRIELEANQILQEAVKSNLDYICAETLAKNLTFSDALGNGEVGEVDLDGAQKARLRIEKIEN